MTVLFDVTLQKVPSTQERFVRVPWVLVGEFALKSLAETELSMTTSSNPANAYGAQMAKYFTMNQPHTVAIEIGRAHV